MNTLVMFAVICIAVKGEHEPADIRQKIPEFFEKDEEFMWSKKPWEEMLTPDTFETEWESEKEDLMDELDAEWAFMEEEHLDTEMDLAFMREDHSAAGVAVQEIKSTLAPSYKIILNDLKSLIGVIKHNITAEDINISHKLMTGPARALFEHPAWSWDSEIIVRGVINSFPMDITRNAHAFHRPDPFDVLNLLRSFFCDQYPCEAGYCALSQFYKLDESQSNIRHLWGEANGNFEDERPPMEFLEQLITDETQRNDVVIFWSSILKFFEAFHHQIDEFTRYPHEEYLKVTLRHKSWIRCVCHEDFGGLYCEQTCFKLPK